MPTIHHFISISYISKSSSNWVKKIKYFIRIYKICTKLEPDWYRSHACLFCFLNLLIVSKAKSFQTMKLMSNIHKHEIDVKYPQKTTEDVTKCAIVKKLTRNFVPNFCYLCVFSQNSIFVIWFGSEETSNLIYNLKWE